MSSMQAQAGNDQPSLLHTRLGALTLLLLCGVQFLDVVDSSITNVALPSIQHALRFSQQNLQWVASGYLLTYGGFLLLGGRLADLLGRRRVLVAGLVVFGACSLAAGLARSEGMLITARVLQGVGAAMMAPAALSILTTTFREGADRNTALGAWGAISGLAAAAGVFLGGVLSEGPGWRWVFYVNIPVCIVALGASFRLLPGGRNTRTGGRLRHAGCAAGHEQHAPPRLRADQSSRHRLGQARNDRDARGCRPASRHVHPQRTPQPQPADAPLDLPGEGVGCGRCERGCSRWPGSSRCSSS